jgi:hypothetical protein
MRFTDTRDDEKERGITIKSTAISMYFPMDPKDLTMISQKSNGACARLRVPRHAHSPAHRQATSS